MQYLGTDAPTDIPTAPTAAPGDNSTQVANTAFVQQELVAERAMAAPQMAGIAAVGTSARLAREDHVHPTDSSCAPLASPALTGTPTAPTPSSSDNSTRIATTAFTRSYMPATLGLGGDARYSGASDLNNAPVGAVIDIYGTAAQAVALHWPQTGATGATPLQYNVFTYGLSANGARLTQIASYAYGDANQGRTWIRTKIDTVWSAWHELALSDSPALTGTPTAPTAMAGDNSAQLATTAFVQQELAADLAMAAPQMDGVAAVGTSSRLARENHVHPTDSSRAPLTSPALTGMPTAPTAATGDNSAQLATTAFVQQELAAELDSPALTGMPTAPTAAMGDNSAQLATTAFVQQELAAELATAAPQMDGVAAVGTSSRLARENHVHPTDSSRAPLVSPALTGTPTAPTAATGDNSAQLATTAFVQQELAADLATTAPQMDGVAAVGTSSRLARENHVHPTDSSRAPLASPALTGTPTAPTAAAGANSTQIASTAFVQQELAAELATAAPQMDGVAAVGTSSKLARENHVHPTDSSRAPLVSPALTGTPTAPTAAAGNNSTQVATTAFVNTAIVAAAPGPASWSSITGKPTTLSGYGITDALPASGTAAAASKLASSRTLTATGDASWNVAFDGTANASAPLTLVNTGVAAGTYPKVSVDAKGRVTAGSVLAAADIPALDWSKIASGKPTTRAGYGITDAAPVNSPVFTGNVMIPEGTQTSPGLVFANDGACNTGLWHMGDDQFGVTCGSTEVVRFTTSGAQFSQTATVPTAAADSNSTQIANTAFVQAALNSSPNLVPNSSAELGMSGWDTDLWAPALDGNSGIGYWYCSPLSGQRGSTYLYSEEFELNINGVSRLAIQMEALTAGLTTGAMIAFVIFSNSGDYDYEDDDGNPAFVGSFTPSGSPFPNGLGWTKYTNVIQVPPDAYYARIQVLITGSPVINSAGVGVRRIKIETGTTNTRYSQEGDIATAMPKKGGWFNGPVYMQPALEYCSPTTLGQFSGYFWGGNGQGAGYQRLPNGLILQWSGLIGFSSGDGNANGTSYSKTVNFPITFPNCCLQSFVSLWCSLPLGCTYIIGSGNETRSSMMVSSYSLNMGAASTLRYFVIGY